MRAYLPTALRGLQRQSTAQPRRPHPWVIVWTMAVDDAGERPRGHAGLCDGPRGDLTLKG